MSFIYLDYNATTPIDPRVAEAMAPFLSTGFGNPSSSHREGLRARQALEGARTRIAVCLGCRPSEIVLTSGGTESNNLALRGLVAARGGGHVVTTSVEHPAVLEVVAALEREGRIEVTLLGVDSAGRVKPSELEKVLRSDTVLVSVMLANNEVGTLQPVSKIAAICRSRGIAVHTDAAQAVGKIPVDVGDLGVDLLSVAGHKLYAPKGVGALFIRDGIEIEPQMRGADHERGLRAGTENVLLAVGLGTACELVKTSDDPKEERPAALRDLLAQKLSESVPGSVIHGAAADRLPNTLSVALPGVEATVLLDRLGDQVAASAGAACHSDGVSVSHVLEAMGVDEETARSTIRLSVGRFTTEEEVERGAAVIIDAARG